MMPSPYEVKNTEPSDLDLIFRLFERSIEYQEEKGYPAWRNYDRQAIIRDIHDKNQYKIVAGDKMAIVYSVAYSDKIIWRQMDQGESIYLHRIVVNPEFKGQKLFGKILDWSINHCQLKGLKSIRMDTWADNPNIINYYTTFGFKIIENYTTPDSPELPVHNRKLAVTLLEYGA